MAGVIAVKYSEDFVKAVLQIVFFIERDILEFQDIFCRSNHCRKSLQLTNLVRIIVNIYTFSRVGIFFENSFTIVTLI